MKDSYFLKRHEYLIRLVYVCPAIIFTVKVLTFYILPNELRNPTDIRDFGKHNIDFLRGLKIFEDGVNSKFKLSFTLYYNLFNILNKFLNFARLSEKKTFYVRFTYRFIAFSATCLLHLKYDRWTHTLPTYERCLTHVPSC